MSSNCISCIKNERTGTDLLCDECRQKERDMQGYERTKQLELKENSAVIVFDQDKDKHSFQLMLPGMMSYSEAPENVKAAVIVAAFLRYDDEDFRKLFKDKGKEYYDRYVAETIVEDLPEEK